MNSLWESAPFMNFTGHMVGSLVACCLIQKTAQFSHLLWQVRDAEVPFYQTFGKNEKICMSSNVIIILGHATQPYKQECIQYIVVENS